LLCYCCCVTVVVVVVVVVLLLLLLLFCTHAFRPIFPWWIAFILLLSFQ
jgi:ABC-type multidrug transport system permease subunit